VLLLQHSCILQRLESLTQGGPLFRGQANAVALRMMIERYRPRRIIEVGSGFTTACILDTLDELGMNNVKVICIEPNPMRLRSLLRESDHGRVTIIEDFVQNVSVNFFEQLEMNDMLLIDGTHVLKTGSDVHFELFYVLPSLKRGVIIHFHDIYFPFEYPEKFIFELNYFWNEAYALRSFLMYNSDFAVLYWTAALVRAYGAQMRREVPQAFPNFG
jgi:predicted O-methyltransferase YrrM